MPKNKDKKESFSSRSAVENFIHWVIVRQVELIKNAFNQLLVFFFLSSFM